MPDRNTTVVNIHHGTPYDVYVGRGRGSPWGNLYSHLSDGTLAEYKVGSRAEAVAKYEEWIQTQPHLLKKLILLKGKVLGCWCHPAACHGHVLAKLADAVPEPEELDLTWESD